MYNGIGLTTPRGSGTNGYVQRNLANVYKQKDKNSFKAPTEISAPSLRKPNTDIIEHDRKRKIELKCLEFQQMLEDQKYSEEEIEKRVTTYRQSLIEDHSAVQKDEHGRIIVKETHEIAEAQLRKNQKLREAFGISEYFVEGSSFDPERHAKEAAAKTAIEETKKYALIPSPPTSDDELPSVETAAVDASPKAKKRTRKSPSSATDVKKKKKKKHKRKSRSSSEHNDKPSKCKKKSAKERKTSPIRDASPSASHSRKGRRSRSASSQPESKKSVAKNKSGKISEKRNNKSRISRSLSSEKSDVSVARNAKSHHRNKKSKHVDDSAKYEKRKKHSSPPPIKSGKHKKERSPSPETRRDKKSHVPEPVDEREKSKHRHRHRGDHADDNDKRQRKELDQRMRRSKRESSSNERAQYEEPAVEERTTGRKRRDAESSNERATAVGRRDTVDEKARRRRRDAESSADERKRRHRRGTDSSTERDQRVVDELSDGERRKRRGKDPTDRHAAHAISGHKRRRSPSSESSSAERGTRRKVRSPSRNAATPPHRTKRSRHSETPPPLPDKRYYAAVQPTNSRKTRKQSSDSDSASEPVAAKSKLKSKVVQKERRTNSRADDRHENRGAVIREQRPAVASTDSETDSEADVESYKSLRPKYASKKRDKHDDLLEEAERKRAKNDVPVANATKSKSGTDEQRHRRDEHIAATFSPDEKGKSKDGRSRKDGGGNVADAPRRTNEQTEQRPVDSKESKKSTQRRGEPKTAENGVSDAGQSAKRDGSASSSLSYSPMEKFPHRYLDILSDMPRKPNRQPAATATVANQRSQKLDDQLAVVSKANDRLRRDAETTSAAESECNKKKEADVSRKAETVTAVTVATTLPVNVMDVPLPADGAPARLSTAATNAAVSKDERDNVAGDVTKTSANNRIHEVVSSALKADPTKTYASLMKLMSTTLRKRRPSSSSSDSSRKDKSRSSSSSSSSSDSSQSSAKSRDSSSSSSSNSSSSNSSSSDESTPHKDRKRRSRSTSTEGHKSRHSCSYSSSDSSRSRSRSRSESKDRKKKKKKKAARRRSRSASDSHSDSSTSSNSRSRSISIPRRRGSPSFLERRRITSARKRPVPYQRLSMLRSPSHGSVSSSSSSSSGISPSSSSSSPVSRHSRLSSPTSRHSKLSSSLPRRRSSSFRTPSPITRSPVPWVTPLTESYDRFNRL